MSPVRNSSRANLAEQALATFVEHAYCGRSTSELRPDDLRDAIADLIADLGHFADRRFRKRTPFTDLASRGVGMWSAERNSRDGNPESNHAVRISVDDGGAP